MFCKYCGEKIEENSMFCNRCGAKLVENNKSINRTESVEEDSIVNDAKPKKNNDKIINVAQKSIFVSLILGLIGFTAFLVTIIVGLIAYGRVYLYDGYDFTKVLVTISIVFMLIGVCAVICKSVLYFVFKIGTFPTTLVKRILIIGLAVTCVAFSIWGFANCGNSRHKNESNDNSDYSDSGSSYYWSFYTVYTDCSCDLPWAMCGTDYLSIDTNPYDYDSDSSSSTTYLLSATYAIQRVNSKLGLPSYLYDEMIETRAIDGRQSYSGTKVNVSWRYHPDSGLEVRYTAK